jgi:hypothetical protein
MTEKNTSGTNHRIQQKNIGYFFIFFSGVLKIHHIPPPLTKYRAMLPSLSTHPLASSVQKKSRPGVGGVFLTKGKRKLEAPTGGEAMMRREAVAGALSDRGGATRGNAINSWGK